MGAAARALWLVEIVEAGIETLLGAPSPARAVQLPEQELVVDVDIEQWARVIQNLLENALLHTDGPVTVGASRMERRRTLWVEDQGQGIPADEHEAVFEKFFRGRRPASTRPRAPGLGLAITREIVRSHGGTIGVDDVAPHGARFVITHDREPQAERPSRRRAHDGPERPTHILVVDDEEQIRRALKSILSTRGYTSTWRRRRRGADQGHRLAARPRGARPHAARPHRHRGLPRAAHVDTAPILILSVRSNEADKIAALDEGADDYLTKPFSAGELLARIRALLRRAAALTSPPPVVTSGDLEIDIARRRVRRAGVEINLTPTEFDILAFLARNAGLVVTQRMILEQVWGPEWVEDAQTLRVHVSNLRKKIEPHPGGPRLIITEPGVGFRFAARAGRR